MLPRVTSPVSTWRQRWRILPVRSPGRDAAVSVCVYTGSYVALDWVCSVQVLPELGLTSWNLSPAASLALLVLKGLSFAPALLVASAVADVAGGGFALGVWPALAGDLIVSIGYTGTAAALLKFAHADMGFSRVTDVAKFLAIVAAGALATACSLAVIAGVMTGLPAAFDAPFIQHAFIGDLTGIVGLLPVLLMLPQARDRWRDVLPVSRAIDIAVFAFGLGLAALVVFGAAHPHELKYFYLLLPPVLWIGVRHGLAWSAVAVLIEQLVLMFSVADLGYQRADFLSFQILSLVVAATGLILGAVVTERQRAERLLRERQLELSKVARLTTAGALGAAVVHEISQPLATVATYAFACRRLLAATPIDLRLLDHTMSSVEEEIQRAGDIVDRLRALLGRNEQRRRSVNPRCITQKVAALLSEEARQHGVTVRTDLRPVCRILADRVQIEQVLMNLIRNAIEAAAEQDRERWVRISLRQAGDDVQIAVEDNGRGVSPEIAPYLFEPFETSKLRGMGLGLWLSREIVKLHGGTLRWDTTVTQGSRFVLFLPCDRAQSR